MFKNQEISHQVQISAPLDKFGSIRLFPDRSLARAEN